MGFFNIHSVAKHQKNEGETLWGNVFFSKSVNAEKTERWDPLVSPGIVFYAGKKEKPFWFSCLGQMVQFYTIKFSRILQNYFGLFVWIENKPGTAQVGFISRAQKYSRNNWKNLEKFLFFKKSIW